MYVSRQFLDDTGEIMIRTIIAVILTAIILIVSLPFLGLQWLLQKKWPHFGERGGFRFMQFSFRLVSLPLGIRLDVIGRENIPSDGPCLFIGNHRSYLDVILAYPLFPSMTGFVAKNAFTKVPVLPIWMRRLYCQFLIEGDIRQNLQSILAAIENVKQGVSMVIYPEGKRGTGEDERELLEFHEGSFKIATKTKCPIVPVAVTGTRECFEQQFPKVRPGHVTIEFGKPIEVSGMSREEIKGIGAKCREVIREMVVKNHDEAAKR